MEELNEKVPANLNKLVLKLGSIAEKMQLQKQNIHEIAQELKAFEKIIDKLIKKHLKVEEKEKAPRKKCGFALPTDVTNELCDFIGVEKETKIARTEVTKQIMSYIKTNNLQNPENKKMIVPDEKLWKLLGEEARGKEITHFTIQKYINKHFIRSKANLKNTMVSTV
jgi:chromatin remodeling complex protein RSC6